MGEEQEYEKTIERLCGEVDALRHMLLSIAEELPERAMYHILDAAKRFRSGADKDASLKPNDRRRDYSAGVWDTITQLEHLLEMRIPELEAGARVRTVQPFPIPANEMLFPDRGW